jgi:hypothetical protein
MIVLSRRHFLLLVFASVAPASLAIPVQAQSQKQIAAAHTPRDVVVDLYKTAAGKDGKYDGLSPISENSIRPRFLSKSLAAALAAMDKKSAKDNDVILDFDPITNSQDPAVNDLVIETEQESETKAVVLARFWSYKKDDTSLVRYLLIKENKLWKIDEITGNVRGEEKDPWSLRAIIK